jgi:hypothetical protein
LKKLLTIWIVIALPAAAWAVTGGPGDFSVRDFLATEAVGVNTAAYDQLVEELHQKRRHFKKEREFVRYVFKLTHQRFLKQYSEFASMDALFTNGTYNCLTGTILYSLLLKESGISHEIIETNYHIFLIAHTGQGDVLLEATDPVGGFVVTPEAIERRKESYQLRSSSRRAYEFSFHLLREVSPSELVGLLYYNRSVEAYNQRQLVESVSFFEKAAQYYHSERMDALAGILYQAVRESALSETDKKKYAQQLKALCAKSAATTPVASLNP